MELLYREKESRFVRLPFTYKAYVKLKVIKWLQEDSKNFFFFDQSSIFV